MGSWFIQKKDKFYGPFDSQKVANYAARGKVAADTLIALDREGSQARPFSEISAQIEADLNQKEEAPPKPEAEPAENAPPGPEAEPATWWIVSGERRFGPHPIDQLQALIRAGKLKPDQPLLEKNTQRRTTVRALFPNMPVAMNSPPSRREPMEDPLAVHLSQTPRQKRTRWGVMITALVIVIIAGIVFLLERPGNVGSDTVLSSLKEKYQEVPTLRNKLKQRDIPPFNDLVQRALREGLNFPIQHVESTNATAQQVYNSNGPRNFGHLFGERIHREVRYILDGPFEFTYLADAQDHVFAVIIVGPTFAKQNLMDYRIQDFAVDAHEEHGQQATTWTEELVPGIIAKAVWSRDKNDMRHLSYLCVTNSEE
jgi:hypothetical protein